MEEELTKVTNISKEIIRKTVLGLFGETALEKVEEAFKSITFNIDNDPKTAEKCVAYCRKNEVYWTESALKSYKGTIYAIAITIHELSHAFSNLISKGKKNAIIEEAIADLFAEICINYYVQNEADISYISHEENGRLKAIGYESRTAYEKQGDFLRSVLYPLKLKGKDLEAIKEYLFNSKNNFVNICTNILGKAFNEILKGMQNVRISVGTDDSDNYLTPSVTEKMIHILYNATKKINTSDIISSDSFHNNRKLYSIYSTALQQVYFLEEIEPYLEGHEITSADIERLTKQIGPMIKMVFENNGIPNYMKDLVLLWYKQSDGNKEAFKTPITFDLLKEIIENNQEISLEEVLDMCDECLNDGNEDMLEYLVDNFATDNNLDFGTISHIYRTCCLKFGCRCIENIVDVVEPLPFVAQFEPDDFIYIIKYCFNFSNREEDLVNFINLLKKKDLLDSAMPKYTLPLATELASELTELHDLQTLINIQKNNRNNTEPSIGTKIIEMTDVDTLTKEIESENIKSRWEIVCRSENRKLELAYRMEIANIDEVLEQIRNRDFKNIKLQFGGIPEWESNDSLINVDSKELKNLESQFRDFPVFVFQKDESNRDLYNIALQQFIEHIDEAENFDIGIKINCRYILDEGIMGADDKTQRIVLEHIRKLIERDKSLSPEEGKRWNNFFDEADWRIKEKNDRISSNDIATLVAKELLEENKLSGTAKMLQNSLKEGHSGKCI